MHKPATLQDVLQYKNKHVLERYQKDFPDKQHLAEDLFTDMLKYLWLCCQHRYEQELNPENSDLNFRVAMHREMADIDDMWHTFILFTKDYANFCHQYFSEFLHHVPNVGEKNPTLVEFERDFTQFLSYVYDKLGEQMVRKWFAIYLQDELNAEKQ